MEMTFESAMERLSTVAQLLRDKDITLDESLRLYEEGTKLIKYCNDKLNQASLKIVDIDGNSLNEK